MKNLELLELRHDSPNNSFDDIKLFDNTLDDIFYIKGGSLHKYDTAHNTSDELCPQVFTNIISIKALQFEQKVCIVTNRSLYIVDPNGVNEIQNVDFEDEIAAVEWNPSEEAVVIVFDNGNIEVFNVDYHNGEVFSQGNSNLESKVPDTVYVGWGSEDTQFRGSEGKLKNKANEKSVEADPVTDKTPRISWRGNGEMFVVNYWRENSRKFIVFESPCDALYRSEDCPGMQSQIAWRPAGNMIATVSKIGQSSRVVIFEKNGQKRFGFSLDTIQGEIIKLNWSPCAKILTIASYDHATDLYKIHLFTSSNYKWYEKQRLEFNQSNPLLTFDWLESTQFTFKLRVVTQRDVINYTFRNVINRLKSTCAVIDGHILQLTNFQNALIPPILSELTIANNTAINFVSIDEDSIATVDSKNILKVFDSQLTLVGEVNLQTLIPEFPQYPLGVHHFALHKQSIYFAVGKSEFYVTDVKGDSRLVATTSDTWRQFLLFSIQHEIHGLKLVENNLYINLSPNLIQQEVKIFNNVAYNCQLLSNCQFYVNNEKINDSVNSFIIFDAYLVYTTKINELFCLRFDNLISEKYKRSVEQGAFIGAAIPETSEIILQLPRGNLETISCRLISIDILDRLLSVGKWEDALRFLRLEKLNANLLFDLSPQRFLTGIESFFSGVKTINELNAIVLEFEEENILNTVYKNWGESERFPGKIAAIFAGVFKYFDQIDYAPYISTIMIINLNFFTLKDALRYVQDLLQRSTEPGNETIDAIDVLKRYGCDQDLLYTESLLLYDLKLAHFVASRCQLDPRVYEPQLNQLKMMTEVERRYNINIFAKKYKIAICYLLRCPNVSSNEVEEFITNHRVSREAYERCGESSLYFQTVSRLFALDLSRKGLHYQAGIVLQKANLLEDALEAFKFALKWREVLNVLNILKLGKLEKLKVLDEVAKALVRNNCFKDAAFLYEVHMNQYEMAVKILIENFIFEEALHLAVKYDRRDIVVHDLIPMVKKHKDYIKDKYELLRDNFEKHRKRLAEVRLEKVQRIDNPCDEDDDRNDLFSDAGSIITKSSRSSRSRSSTASSRNRRKEEKKKQDLRKGGIYEDIALIRAIYCLVKELYSKADEVHTCSVLLLQESNLSYREIKEFHDQYWSIYNSVKNSMGEIWPPHFITFNQSNNNVQEIADLENFQHLDMEYRTPPAAPVQNPMSLFKAT